MYLNNLLKENTHKQDSIVEAEPGLKGGTTTTPSGIITPVDMNTKPAKPLSAWEKLKQQTADKFKTPKIHSNIFFFEIVRTFKNH